MGGTTIPSSRITNLGQWNVTPMWIGGEDLGDFYEWTSKWKPVDDADTQRMAVPGGWLYRTVIRGIGIAVAFVPVKKKPEHVSRRQRSKREVVTSSRSSLIRSS